MEHRLSEIIANAITHGIGAALAIIGAVILIVASVAHGTVRHVLSCTVFGGTLVLVYICSTLYHALVLTRANRVFRVLDHAAIYLLIAGTYTPFMIVSLRGTLGGAVLAVVWSLAAAGVVFKSVALERFPEFSTAAYVAMGWLGVITLRPLAWTDRIELTKTPPVALLSAREKMPFGVAPFYPYLKRAAVAGK